MVAKKIISWFIAMAVIFSILGILAIIVPGVAGLAVTFLVGWASILKHGGMQYGIDFRGGTLVYVRFAGPAPLDQIRKGLSSAGLNDSTIQTISDNVLGGGSQNDVVIGLEQKGQNDETSLDAGRTSSKLLLSWRR